MSDVKTNVRSRATHLAGIDGLRAFAALSVLFAHTAAFSVCRPGRSTSSSTS